MKTKLFAALASAGLAGLAGGALPAQAEGLYISGSLGSTTLGHTLERNEATPGLPVPDVAGVSLSTATDVSAGLAFGYEFQANNSPFFFGAEAFYTFENSETRNIVGVLATDVSLDASYGARLIGGVDVAPKFSVYGHAGYTQLEFDVRNSYTFAPPVKTHSFSEGGFSYGVGALYHVNDRFSVFTEYTKIPDVDFAGLPEVAGGTGRVNPNDLSLDKVSFGVRMNF